MDPSEKKKLFDCKNLVLPTICTDAHDKRITSSWAEIRKPEQEAVTSSKLTKSFQIKTEIHLVKQPRNCGQVKHNSFEDHDQTIK